MPVLAHDKVEPYPTNQLSLETRLFYQHIKKLYIYFIIYTCNNYIHHLLIKQADLE